MASSASKSVDTEDEDDVQNKNPRATYTDREKKILTNIIDGLDDGKVKKILEDQDPSLNNTKSQIWVQVTKFFNEATQREIDRVTLRKLYHRLRSAPKKKTPIPLLNLNSNSVPTKSSTKRVPSTKTVPKSKIQQKSNRTSALKVNARSAGTSSSTARLSCEPQILQNGMQPLIPFHADPELILPNGQQELILPKRAQELILRNGSQDTIIQDLSFNTLSGSCDAFSEGPLPLNGNPNIANRFLSAGGETAGPIPGPSITPPPEYWSDTDEEEVNTRTSLGDSSRNSVNEVNRTSVGHSSGNSADEEVNTRTSQGQHSAEEENVRNSVPSKKKKKLTKDEVTKIYYQQTLSMNRRLNKFKMGNAMQDANIKLLQVRILEEEARKLNVEYQLPFPQIPYPNTYSSDENEDD